MSGKELGAHRFLWGVATSPYQIEGGITNNDWDFFTNSKLIKDRIYALTKPSIFYKTSTQITLQPAGDAVKAWDPNYYERDYDIARRLGMNSFRIGIEWSRIEPSKDIWNYQAIDHYKEMIRSMRDKGLVPIITLNHVTLPLWVLTPPGKFTKKIGQRILPSPLKDLPLADPPSTDPYWKSLRGWETHRTVEEFVKYVAKIVSELKDLVDYWITISEPVASIIGGGYIAGLWPPGFFLDGIRAKIVLHNLIEAHVQAYDKIIEVDDIDADGDGVSKQIGFTHLMMAISPAKPNKIFDVFMTDVNTKAAKNFDYFVNDYFINAITKGEEDINYLNTLEIQNKNSSDFIIHDEWKDKVDFIGLDYYRRVYIYHSNIVALSSARFVGGALINDLHKQEHNQPHGILNDLGWEIYPQGLYNLIMKIKSRWNKPVFITENGIADKSDRYRAPFIVAHLEQVRRAISDSADVIGYLHWSLMDNYEWLERYRPEAKFGLLHIDHAKGDLRRQMTKGAEAIKLIIEESISQSRNGIITEYAISKSKDKFGIINDDGSNIIYT
ncbi:MAG TPA: family 1 glycosylhydrolase [Nitrososphaeraceae archaeon]|nr:family 1 glycosylhydrolase [Nitrososphaeraceae archaeon]